MTAPTRRQVRDPLAEEDPAKVAAARQADQNLAPAPLLCIDCGRDWMKDGHLGGCEIARLASDGCTCGYADCGWCMKMTPRPLKLPIGWSR